jgi:Tol biopolymer transport system component
MRIIILVLLLVAVRVSAQENPVGIFQDHKDIGHPKLTGTASYDATDQHYGLRGAGYNIWFERDEFHYAYGKIKGDFIVTGDFEFVGAGTDGHRKIGWMVRESLDDNASHVSAVTHGDGLTVLQWRRLKGAFMRDPQDEIFTPKHHYRTIQLERQGKKITMRGAHPGEPLQDLGSVTLEDMPDEVFVGLFIGSHNPDVVEEAKVWNVRIDQPVPDDYNAYRQGFILGSRLEIMNVFEGKRKIIYEEPGRFEAPNWTRDGKSLIINKDGSLYKIPVAGGTLEAINTGDVKRNNNDHVLSFDGKWIGISSHRDGMPGGGSTVYVVPAAGGTPRLLTEKTPSYLHGWSPDGKELVYTAQRDGKNYDIYKMPVAGGIEVKLTNSNGTLADGPEISPDGKFIYFNNNVSGSMQLWRMKRDGSSPEQLTFDENNNWFAHVSPDGKWIAYISFPPTIPVNDHPAYKRVTLRLMPANGGASKVIAYLYGGQGTINVPSWSPDSKSIAFVSYGTRP